MRRRFATKKNIDTEIREQYGWTQNALADYLGIGRSLLSLCEMGERSLPSKASLKWLEWMKFSLIEDALQKARAALVVPAPDTTKLLRQADDCEWEAGKLRRKLAVIQKRYEQALNNIALCRHLLNITPVTEENKFEREQLELSLSLALKTHRNEGPEAIAMMQCKIDSLLHEAELCKQQAAALDGDKK